MATSVVELPITYYFNPDQGKPLFLGSVFIGEPNLDPQVLANRKEVTLIEQDGTIVVIAPEAQPLRTGPGGSILYNGSSVSVYTEDNYSIKVLDNQNVQKFFVASAFEGVPIDSDEVIALIGQLSRLKFNDVEDMVNATGLIPPADPNNPQTAVTNYYANAEDAGNNAYIIEALTADPEDGGLIIKSIGSPTIQFRGTFPGGRIIVNQFGETGLADDSTVMQNAKSYSESINTTLHFSKGTYNYLKPMVFAQNDQTVTFDEGVILNYTGTDLAGVRLDAGTSGFVYNGSFGANNSPILRSPNAPFGIYVRSWHHGEVGFICESANNTAMRVDFAVLTRFDIECSANRSPFLNKPIQGLLLSERNEGESVTACDFYCIIEGVSGEGIVCTQAQYNSFYGTSEGNDGGGYTEGTECIGNNLNGLFCEANGNTDFNLAGNNAYLSNVVSNSDSGIVVTGRRNYISGATKNFRIEASAQDNVISDFSTISTEGGGSFIDNSPTTVYQNVRMNSTLGSTSIPDKYVRPKIKRVGPISIQAVSSSVNCIVTINGHGLDIGESITINNVNGTTELNGNTYTVEIVDNNNVWILSGDDNVDSTPFGFYAGGGDATQAPFLNNWNNSSSRLAGFSVSAQGLVSLSGIVSGGALGTPIFNLPVPFRPQGSMLFLIVSGTTPSNCYLNVTSTGNVTPVTGGITSLNMDGVSYQLP